MEYQDYDEDLRRVGAQADLPEIHGSLCGRLCAIGDGSLSDWLEESLSGIDEHVAVRNDLVARLTDMHAEQWRDLEQGRIDFQPLLPPEAQPMTVRARSLGLWCQGFLQGLAQARLPAAKVMEEQLDMPHVAEAMRDFARIAELGFAGRAEHLEAEQAEEGAEEDYAQLVEYVRVAVQMAYEELTPWRAARTSASSSPQ